jgi:hypothetical protein
MHLYISHPDDRLGVRALGAIKALGGQTELIRSFSMSQEGVRAFFTSPGNYPSKHVRKLRLPHDVESRGFSIPLWMPNPCELYALRDIPNPTRAQLHNFDEAMRHVFYSDLHGAWTGPKKKRRSRRGGHGSNREKFLLP